MEGILLNTNLDHIGIVVMDIEEARNKFSKLFGKPFHSEDFVFQKIILDKYKLNNCVIEVFQPYPDNEHLQKFLSKHGEGIHHICVGKVNNVQIQCLKDNSYKLIYTDWQSGSENSKINFIHPASLCKVLLELKC